MSERPIGFWKRHETVLQNKGIYEIVDEQPYHIHIMGFDSIKYELACF